MMTPEADGVYEYKSFIVADPGGTHRAEYIQAAFVDHIGQKAFEGYHSSFKGLGECVVKAAAVVCPGATLIHIVAGSCGVYVGGLSAYYEAVRKYAAAHPQVE